MDPLHRRGHGAPAASGGHRRAGRASGRGRRRGRRLGRARPVGGGALPLPGCADYAGARCEIVDGRYTGRLKGPIPYGGEKARVAARFIAEHGADPADCWAYADHDTDIELLRFGGPSGGRQPSSRSACRGGATGLADPFEPPLLSRRCFEMADVFPDERRREVGSRRPGRRHHPHARHRRRTEGQFRPSGHAARRGPHGARALDAGISSSIRLTRSGRTATASS